jgi:hypothetical protein
MLVLLAPGSRLRWALAGAVAFLGLILLLSGGNIAEWAAAAFTWATLGFGSGA